SYRLKAFNTAPDLENKIDEDWWGLTDKNVVISEYTAKINESLFDDSEFLYDHIKALETKLLLKTIIGSAITSKEYLFDKSKIPLFSLLDPRCSNPELCDHTDVFEILDEEIEACYSKRPNVPFRYFKQKSLTIGNTRGGSNGTLGRKFGNPDAADLSLAKKEAIEGSMRDYLNVRRLLSPLYLEVKRRSYLEVESDEEVSELSERAVLALDTMARNADSERL
ncbi:MAG: hypothetical protein NWS47_03385, partial [Alphaproteobacteria bacterium]|nr:hypothetical protein [Alphaproteobacteria bacterium]